MAWKYKFHLKVEDAERYVIEGSTNDNTPNLADIIDTAGHSGLLDNYCFYYVRYYTYTNKEYFYASEGYQLDNGTYWYMNATSLADVTELDIVFCHKVQFDFNGGSGGLEEVPAVCGEKLPNLDKYDLPDPPEDGYVFDGYWTSKTTTNTKFQYYNADGKSTYVWGSGEGAADIQHASGTYTLYAHWKKLETTTIIYNANGGYFDDGSTISSEPIYGETSPISATIIREIPTRTFTYKNKPYELTFNYWALLNSDGTIYKTYHPNSSTSFTSVYPTHTLTAIWSPIFRLVDYNNNDAVYDEIEVTYGESIPSQVDVPVKEGYEFLGYYAGGSTSTKKFYDANGYAAFDDEWLGDGDGDGSHSSMYLLYAHWKEALSIFEWTYEKRTGMEWNLTHEEWNALQDFINNKRDTPYAFMRAAKGMDFTADIYNEILISLGVPEELYVKKGQPITEKLMYDIVDRANAM